MDMKEIKVEARKKLKGFCAVCSVCDGVWCAGQVPGMGGSITGSSFQVNVEDLSKVKLRLKTIHNAKEPSTAYEFFGKKLDFPVMAAPITGTKFNMGGALTEEEYIDSVIKGSKEAGSLGMTGDSADPNLYNIGLEAIEKYESFGVPVIKPRENNVIIDMIKKAEKLDIPGIGMDIDGAGLITMALENQPVGPKSFEEVREIVDSTDLPFIVKGIMTEEDAENAIKAGAKAIVVSNHGGRVLDGTSSTARALYSISKKFKGQVHILVDGGVRSGVDVLKMLALGADGVLIGRPIVTAAFANHSEGVKTYLNTIKNQLFQAMILTGVSSLEEIDKSIVNIEW